MSLMILRFFWVILRQEEATEEEEPTSLMTLRGFFVILRQEEEQKQNNAKKTIKKNATEMRKPTEAPEIRIECKLPIQFLKTPYLV